MLLTRAEEQNARIAHELAAQGVATMCWPLSRIVFPDVQLSVPPGTDAVVFTSANGVAGFARACATRDLPAICVGKRTTGTARDQGFASVICAGQDVRALIDHLGMAPGRSYFYARGRDVSVDLAACLAPGISLTERVVYAAEPAGAPESDVRDALLSGRISAISIWSRRNGEVLVGQLAKIPEVPVSQLDLVAISENAAQPLGNSGFRRICVSQTPDAQGMIAEISAAVRQDSLGR